MLAHWGEIDKGAVIRPILGRQLPLGVARYAAEILSLGDTRLPSLLDPAPLRRNLRRWIDWHALHDNVQAGAVRAVAAITTAACSGRTVAFVEGAPLAELGPRGRLTTCPPGSPSTTSVPRRPCRSCSRRSG